MKQNFIAEEINIRIINIKEFKYYCIWRLTEFGMISRFLIEWKKGADFWT